MMKALPEEALEEIRQIMNLVMKEGHAPEDWKTGIITPIFKKGDSKECGNYRGITILSIVAKTFARVLEKRLRNILEDTLEDSQFGFRPNRGINDAIFILRQLSEKTIKEGTYTYVLLTWRRPSTELTERTSRKS